MRHSTDSLIVRGGVTLFTQTWLPESEPKAVVIIAHGFAEHSGRYGHVADALVSAGYAVVGYDHRGHGRSSGQRGLVRDIQDLSADLALVRSEAVAKAFPGVEQILLGHSVGGAVVVAHLAGEHDPVRAAVLSAPYLRNAVSVPLPLKLMGSVLGRLLPGLPTQALEANDVSRDADVVHDYDTDPLNYRGGLPAGSVAALLGLDEALLPLVDTISEPVLIVHGEDDKIAAVAGSRDLAARLGSEDVTLKVYPKLYHEVFNEPERKQVLDDVVDWLSDR